MSAIYDKAYFIAKFEAIPEKQWCVGVDIDDKGRCCARGHCGVRGQVKEEEGYALYRVMSNLPGTVAGINDGRVRAFPQPTPKQRILAALRSLP